MSLGSNTAPSLGAVDSPAGSQASGLLAAAIAVSAWGAGGVLAKGIDMDPTAIAVYRFGFFSVILVTWMSLRDTPLTLRAMRLSAFGGIALGLDVALFFSAVKLTNVVNATLIGALQPVFVGIVAARFFGESIRKRDALLSLGALSGVGLVMVASNGTPEWSATGDGLAFLAMIGWGCYFIASKLSKGRLTTVEFTAGTAVWTTAINIPLAIAFGQDLSWPSRPSLGWLALMIVLAGFVGHNLMNWSLVRIPLWVASTMTLLIPVISSLIAWVALGENLTFAQAGAMGLVLLALALIVNGQTQTSETSP